MKYRQKKNSLAASMKTVVNVESKEELISHIEKTWNKKIKTIRFDYATFDSRIQWDAYNVTVSFENGDRQNREIFIGISDGQF